MKIMHWQKKFLRKRRAKVVSWELLLKLDIRLLMPCERSTKKFLGLPQPLTTDTGRFQVLSFKAQLHKKIAKFFLKN